MLKKILIFLIILILLVLAGVFMVNKTASAASQTYENLTQACPSGIDGCKDSDGKLFTETKGGERYIRMQIAIPGITDSCTYKVEDINKKEVIKTCNYVSSNLPDYVKKFYNFAVGAIAILAVIMIMIAGLQWIFAAGNPTTITTARSNITSAISGLVLILFSYVLLYTINPNLVNLSLTQPKPIAGIEQGTFWCMDLNEKATNGSKFVFFEEGYFGDRDYIFTKREDTLCYKKYHFAYRDSLGKLVKPEEDKLCYGNDCANGGDVCVGEMGFTYCIDPVDLCEKKTDASNCEDVNKSFAKMSSQPDVLENSCFRRDDKWSKGFAFDGADECVWNERLVCPGNLNRVSCLSGTVLDESKKTGCHTTDKKPVEAKKGGVFYVCSDSTYANIEANLICCKDGNNFKLYGKSSSALDLPSYVHKSSNMTIDCNSIKKCSDYSTSQEACLRNICEVPYSCQWTGNSCKAK